MVFCCVSGRFRWGVKLIRERVGDLPVRFSSGQDLCRVLTCTVKRPVYLINLYANDDDPDLGIL
jgi:hypothetical protein